MYVQHYSEELEGIPILESVNTSNILWYERLSLVQLYWERCLLHVRHTKIPLDSFLVQVYTLIKLFWVFSSILHVLTWQVQYWASTFLGIVKFIHQANITVNATSMLFVYLNRHTKLYFVLNVSITCRIFIENVQTNSISHSGHRHIFRKVFKVVVTPSHERLVHIVFSNT